MKTIGFIGAGNMANALISGILSAGLFTGEQIYVSDTSSVKLEYMREKYGVSTLSSNSDLVSKCDVVVFAIKPQVAEYVIKSLEIIGEMPLFVSIISGVTIEKIQWYLPGDAKVVRVMPNTPALIHMGVSAVSSGNNVSQNDIYDIHRIFECVGSVMEVDESLINNISAISGSGPAYFYLILEAMSDAGVRMGLTRAMSLRLAAQTAVGAAKMVLETGKHPSELKDMVTSPAGTTIEAICEFEKLGLRSAIINGVCAAGKKANEHSKDY